MLFFSLGMFHLGYGSLKVMTNSGFFDVWPRIWLRRSSRSFSIRNVLFWQSYVNFLKSQVGLQQKGGPLLGGSWGAHERARISQGVLEALKYQYIESHHFTRVFHKRSKSHHLSTSSTSDFQEPAVGIVSERLSPNPGILSFLHFVLFSENYIPSSTQIN